MRDERAHVSTKLYINTNETEWKAQRNTYRVYTNDLNDDYILCLAVYS